MNLSDKYMTKVVKITYFLLSVSSSNKNQNNMNILRLDKITL